MMAARARPLPASSTFVERSRNDEMTPPTIPKSAGSELMGPAKIKVERPMTENRREMSASGLVRETDLPPPPAFFWASNVLDSTDPG